MIENNDTNFIAIKDLESYKLKLHSGETIEKISFKVGFNGMIKLKFLDIGLHNPRVLSYPDEYDISDQLAALIVDKALKVYEEQKGKENV